MKQSELTVELVKEYLRINDDDNDVMMVGAILAAARQRAMAYTGRTSDELDNYDDVTLAILALCAELWDVRQATIQGGAQINPTTAGILDAYAVNLL